MRGSLQDSTARSREALVGITVRSTAMVRALVELRAVAFGLRWRADRRAAVRRLSFCVQDLERSASAQVTARLEASTSHSSRSRRCAASTPVRDAATDAVIGSMLMGSASGELATYAFVDLGYLLGELAELSDRVLGQTGLRPSIADLKEFFRPACRGGPLRFFVYYAAEADPSSAERAETQAATIAWLADVQRIPDVHVRWGDVIHRPRKGGRIQKRVDVMLAVDMMKHAFRRTMDHAILLAGDLDFHPLVQEVVESGCKVTVAAAAGRSGAAELLDAADVVLDLDRVAVFNLAEHGIAKIIRTGVQPTFRCHLVATGPRGRAWYGDSSRDSGLPVVSFGDPPVQHRAWAHRHTDPEVMKRLALYEIGCDRDDAWLEPTPAEAAAFAEFLRTLSK